MNLLIEKNNLLKYLININLKKIKLKNLKIKFKLKRLK